MHAKHQSGNVNRMQKHSLQPDRDYEEKWPNMVLLQHSKMPLPMHESEQQQVFITTQKEWTTTESICNVAFLLQKTLQVVPPHYFFYHKVVPLQSARMMATGGSFHTSAAEPLPEAMSVGKYEGTNLHSPALGGVSELPKDNCWHPS